jgi:hypothetical protein
MLDTINLMKRIIFIILLNPDATADDSLGAIIQTFFQKQGRLATSAYESWYEIISLCQKLSRQIIEQEENAIEIPNLNAKALSEDPRVIPESKRLISKDELKKYYRFFVALDPLAEQSDPHGAIIMSSYGDGKLGQTGSMAYENWADIVPKLQEHAEKLVSLHKSPLNLPPVPQIKAPAPKASSKINTGGKTATIGAKTAGQDKKAKKAEPKYYPPFILEQKGKRRSLLMMDDFDIQEAQQKNKSLQFSELNDALEVAKALAKQDNIAITVRDKNNQSILVPPDFQGLSAEHLNDGTLTEADETPEEYEDNVEAQGNEENLEDTFDENDEALDDANNDDEFAEHGEETEELVLPYSVWIEQLKIELKPEHPMPIIKLAPNKEYEFDDLEEANTFAEQLANHVGNIITIQDATGTTIQNVRPTRKVKA